MTEVDQKIGRKRLEDHEITPTEVVNFFRSNWKFLSLLTLGLSAVVVALTLSLSNPQYSKQLRLSVQPSPDVLLSRLLEPQALDVVGSMTLDTAGKAAVGYLTYGDFGQVKITPTYDETTGQVQVIAQSPDRDSLDVIGSELVNVIMTESRRTNEEASKDMIDEQVGGLEQSVGINKEVIAQLDQLIEQASSTSSGDSEGNSNARAKLEGLENVRAGTVAKIAEDEAKIRYIEQSREGTPQLAGRRISATILDESDTRQFRWPLTIVVVVAVVSSFVVAVIVTIIREVLRHRRAKSGRK